MSEEFKIPTTINLSYQNKVWLKAQGNMSEAVNRLVDAAKQSPVISLHFDGSRELSNSKLPQDRPACSLCGATSGKKAQAHCDLCESCENVGGTD